MRVLLGVLLSLAIHLFLAGGLVLVPEHWRAMGSPAQIAEITLVENPDETPAEQLLVRETTPPENLKIDSEDPARFRSETEKRVVLETKARNIGLTRNGEGLRPDSWLKQVRPRGQNAPQAQAQQRQLDGYEPIRIPRAGEDNLAFEDAPSTVGEVLPDDISLGNFTALNTDRFKYYSFYSRVEELVRFRWERELQSAIEAFDRQYLMNVVGRREWISRVEFWLTKDGRFHSAHIHRESGIRRFDLAAINAFRDASIFPNPPREMVEGDGYIRLKYTFNVRWTPGAMAGSR